MATSSLIGALRVTLGLDTAEFEAGSKRAKEEATELGHTLGEKVSEGAEKAKQALELFGLYLGARELIEATKHAFEYTASLVAVAQQLGVTNKDLQAYRYAATQVGVSQEDVEKGLSKLTQTLGKVKAGAKEPIEALADLGIKGTALRDVANKTAGDALPTLAEAFAKIVSPTKRARDEVELFGKTGQRLDPLLSQGAGGIDGLREAAEKAGAVLSDEQIERLDSAAHKFDALKLVLEAKIAGAVADNSETILGLADAFTYLVGKIEPAINALKAVRAGLGLLQDMDAQYLSIRYPDRQAAAARIPGEQSTLNNLLYGEPAEKEKNKSGVVTHDETPVVDDHGAAARKAEEARLKAIREQLEYEQKNATISHELYGLRQQLTPDVRQQALYQHEDIDLAAKSRQEELAQQVSEKKITQAHADEIETRSETLDTLKHSLVNRQLDAKLSQQDLDTTIAGITNQRDLLGLQQALAKTAAERRDIELKLLDLQYQEERARLETTIASKDTSDAERKIAQKRLDQLGELQNTAAAGVKQATQGPLETYISSVYTTAGQKAEAFQQTAVDGLKSIEDQVTDTISGVFKLGGAFGKIADSIISDLIRIEVQQNITGPLAKAISGGGGGLFGSVSKLLGLGSSSLGVSSTITGAGSIAPSGISDLSALSSIPHLAGGGTIGGISGIDKNLLSLNGMPAAWVNKGEQLSVTPDNDNGPRGGSFTFDLRGAVMTQDLLNQMNAIGQAATVGGAGLALSTSATKKRRQLGG